MEMRQLLQRASKPRVEGNYQAMAKLLAARIRDAASRQSCSPAQAVELEPRVSPMQPPKDWRR